MAKNVKVSVKPKVQYIPKYIIVHHSAAKSPLPQFDAINEWHKERDFAESELGFFVGYHRVIEKDGRVMRARNDLERDCDALGHNYDSLSVCLVGNFDVETPTPQQETALAAVLQEWCHLYAIDEDDIYTHRHFAATACPGKNISDNWPKLVYLNAEGKRISKTIASLSVGR